MATRDHIRSESGPAALNITPLIDMVFILLIFFAVNASFVKEAGVEIERPSASTAVTQQQANIMIAVTENSEVWVDRQRVDSRSEPDWSSRCSTRCAWPASRMSRSPHRRTSASGR